jgi:putative SOS response-associated peptidase YedK
MCGRFTLRTPATILIEHFDLDVRDDRQLALFEPRYNIAPTQDIVVVRADPASGRRTALNLRWGLVPSWTKELTPGPPMINARSETLGEKPAFRTAYRQRRCLIPADGFYEWKQSATAARGKKQPYYIHRPDGAPFAFAGLWESWRAPGDRSTDTRPLESCTVITTAANAALEDLHDRMPVVLSPNDYARWLDPAIQEPSQLQYLLRACPNDELVAEPVSTHVNSVSNDDPRCVAVQKSLFD